MSKNERNLTKLKNTFFDITMEKGQCLKKFVFVFLETRLLQLQKSPSFASKSL